MPSQSLTIRFPKIKFQIILEHASKLYSLTSMNTIINTIIIPDENDGSFLQTSRTDSTDPQYDFDSQYIIEGDAEYNAESKWSAKPTADALIKAYAAKYSEPSTYSDVLIFAYARKYLVYEP